jgi:hypothetical protein
MRKGEDTMPMTTSHTAAHQDATLERLTSAWNTIRESLAAKQNQIYDDIANYPPPIPACDQHFNYLLEQRTGIAQELRRQKTLAEQCLTSSHPVALIREFMTSSHYLSRETKQNILDCLADM